MTEGHGVNLTGGGGGGVRRLLSLLINKTLHASRLDVILSLTVMSFDLTTTSKCKILE